MKTELNAQHVARQGLLLILIAAVLWGTVGIVTKALYDLTTTNALSIGFLRLAVAAPALFLACWSLLGRRTLSVARRDLGLMLLIGIAMALYQVCYFAAIALVGVAIAVLIALCTAPVMVALIAAATLGERLSGRVLLALVCALSGTSLLVGLAPQSGAATQNTLLGVGLALGAGLSYAVVTLCSRALAGRYHPLQPISIGFGAGALLLLPFALANGLVLSYSAAGWALLLYLGLLPTALAYLFFLRAMRHTSATVASIVTLLEPLISTVLAWAIFGERLGASGIIGASLLLGAIMLLYQGAARRVQVNAA